MKLKKRHIFWVIFLPFQIWLVQLAKDYPDFIERYYSNGIYPYISKFLRILLGWVPFSFGDVLLIFLIFLFFRSLYKFIKNRFKNFIGKLVHFIAILSFIYFCFYLFWGLNYYRHPLNVSLNYSTETYTTEQLEKTTKYIVNQLNTVHSQLVKNDSILLENPYEVKEMYKMSVLGYENLSKDFHQFEYKNSSVKSSLVSLLQTYNGTAGYLNPLTGEAQVNDRIPKTGMPTTICHEISHQIGFAAENEANFVGFLAANYNDDLYFKYASYRMAFGYCIREMRKRDVEKSKEIWKTVNRGILKDFDNSYEFWQAYKNPFEPVIKKGYSAYLKANNQAKGTDSYNYVVDLLISHFEKTIFSKQ